MRLLPTAQAFKNVLHAFETKPTLSKLFRGWLSPVRCPTLCRLNRRMRGHRDMKSAIHIHFYADHLTPTYAISKNESNFKILCRKYHDIVRMKLPEALLIRKLNAHTNVYFNEISNFSNFYS